MAEKPAKIDPAAPPADDRSTVTGPTHIVRSDDGDDLLPPPEPSRVPPLQLPSPLGWREDKSASPPTIPGYEILGELGRGGMGVVYRAKQISLNRLVALKMIRSADLASPQDFARFQSEAEAVARLKHPNIVHIYEVNEHEGRPYFALEYVEGGSLAQKVKGLPQPARTAAELVEVLARAVHAAHQRGIIHRDLKPSNILLTPDGAPKITDFGLAKRLDDSPLTTHHSLVTQTGAVMGTPSYMAPEQAAGKSKEIGPAADVYSLGAILYELLTGRPPFLAESWEATRQLVVSQEPVPPRRLQPKLPRDLQTICLKCLDKEPRRRYASAEALAEDLRRYLDGKPITSRPIGPVGRLWRWTRRKPALAGLGGLGALTAIAVIIALIGIALFKSGLSRENRIRAAFDALDKGIDLCERGEGAQGMLWIARSLKLTPSDVEDLQETIRRNLAGWGKEIHNLKAVLPHRGDVLAVAFDKDGERVWTASKDGTAQLWNAATGKPLGPPILFDKEVSAVAFSRYCDRILIGSEDGMAQVWDVVSGKPVGKPFSHGDSVRAVAFSPDGAKLVTGGEDGIAQLWHTAKMERGKPLRHGHPVSSVSFAPDSGTVLTGGTSAHLWDASTGNEVGKGASRPTEVEAVAFSPDGMAILIAGRNGAALWDLDIAKPLVSFPHGGVVDAIAFSPDGRRVLTGGIDSTARLWERDSGKAVGNALAHGKSVQAVAFSPDGKSLLTGSMDETARIWDVRSSQPFLFSPRHKGWVYRLAFSHNTKTLVSGSEDGTGRLWEAASGQLLQELSHQGRWVRAVAFSPDDKVVLTASDDKTAKTWEAGTGKFLFELRHGASVVDAAFSPTENTILTGSDDKTGQLWNAVTGARLATLQHDNGVQSVAFNPDGKKVLTGSADNTAKLWDAMTGAHLATLPHDHWVTAVAFSGDGSAAITGGNDKKARLWEVPTGAPRGPPLLHDGGVYAVAISPDERTALTGSGDKTARLWDAFTGAHLQTLSHQGNVRSVAFSRDGKNVLTGSYDQTARLWDTATGRALAPPFRHPKQVQVVLFSPDDESVLTGSWDGYIRRWKVPEPVEGAPERLIRCTQVITGMELDSSGMVHVLDFQRWDQQRQFLEQEGCSLRP